MEVKTYEATSIKDAIRAIKRDLGKDAVILSTKNLTPTDGEGLKRVEVTAAAPVASKAGALTGATSSKNIEMSFGQFNGQMQRLQTELDTIKDSMVHKEDIELLKSGVRDLRSIILDLVKPQWTSEEGSALPPAAHSLLTRLRTKGIDESIIQELAQALIDVEIPADEDKSSTAIYLETARRWFMRRVKVAPPWGPIPGGSAIHLMVGSHGSGKTTLLHKAAAHLALRDKKRISLVTCDTGRIAAGEVTRVYAKILDVSCHHIKSLTEIKTVVESSKDVDIFLVDTGGVSCSFPFFSPDHFMTVRQLGLPVDVHLVLPVTQKLGFLEDTIKTFSGIGVQSLCFTHLDEISSYADVVNAGLRWNLPLSYGSFSADLTEGLERLDKEKIVQQIFDI